jgi:hypothetical protein
LELSLYPVRSHHQDTNLTIVNWFAQWDVVAHDVSGLSKRRRGELSDDMAWTSAATMVAKYDDIYNTGQAGNQDE